MASVWDIFDRLGDLRRAVQSGRVDRAFAERVILAVTQVNGCRYCSYAHTRMAMQAGVTRRVLSMVREGTQPANPFRDLTDRELMVLRKVAQGKTNHEITEKLVLSEKTVRNHISTILDKLGVENRVEAATYAVQHRLTDYLQDKNL